MSGIAKAASKNIAYGGTELSGKAMKNMNEALIERLREGTTLISELKNALGVLEKEKAALEAKCHAQEDDIIYLNSRLDGAHDLLCKIKDELFEALQLLSNTSIMKTLNDVRALAAQLV
jgi:predicted nuclease with TOPRIM domain